MHEIVILNQLSALLTSIFAEFILIKNIFEYFSGAVGVCVYNLKLFFLY